MKDVDWSGYARVYDMVLQYNPAYQAIVDEFEAIIADWPLADGARVLDLGTGTGNFGLRLAQRFPQVRVTLFDRDAQMLELARQKALALGVANVEFRQGDASRLDGTFEDGQFGAVLAVHCLYTLPRPTTLAALRALAAPGALGYFCDLGRIMDSRDWARFLFGEIRRRHGLLKTAEVFWRGRRIAADNDRIRMLQEDGTYWLHSEQSFVQAIQAAGFDVLRSGTTFRGMSDFAVVRTGTAR